MNLIQTSKYNNYQINRMINNEKIVNLKYVELFDPKIESLSFSWSLFRRRHKELRLKFSHHIDHLYVERILQITSEGYGGSFSFVR